MFSSSSNVWSQSSLGNSLQLRCQIPKSSSQIFAVTGWFKNGQKLLSSFSVYNVEGKVFQFKRSSSCGPWKRAQFQCIGRRYRLLIIWLSWGGRVGRIGWWLHSPISACVCCAHSTAKPATNPPNAPTPTQLDYEQSVKPSYPLQLCTFSRPIAAKLYKFCLMSCKGA